MPTVRLDRWEDVRDAFRNRALRQALYDAGEVVMSDCLLNLHGVEHRDRRRLENRLFRRSTFERWEHELLGPTIETTLAGYRTSGKADLVELGYALSMNLTATIAGLDIDPTDHHRSSSLLTIVAKLSEGATMAHTTRNHDELAAEVEAALQRLDAEFLQPAIASRSDGSAGTDRADVLTTLLHNREQLGLTDAAIRREIGFYLQAGAHSTANTLVHSFDMWWSWTTTLTGAAGADPFVVEMDQLQRVVHESLRLHPASPVALRRALEDTELADGRRIRAGDLVELDLMAANRDPAVFGQTAERFDPDRSMPELVPLWGHSFGGGVHACIGRELDGGVPADERAGQPAAPLYGSVAVMLAELLQARFEPDPDRPAQSLTTSSRAHYGVYPIRVRPEVL